MNREDILAWAAHDPDPETKELVLEWLKDNNAGELGRAFAAPLGFGTAGIRGRVGPGPAQMNLAVVLRTTWGLMQWLNQQVDSPVVVVGCDARHGSTLFARAAAEVIAALGGKALTLPEAHPTPLTAFSGCCCNLGREPRKLRFYCVINAMCLCCQAVSNTRLTITASGFG